MCVCVVVGGGHLAYSSTPKMLYRASTLEGTEEDYVSHETPSMYEIEGNFS